MKKLLLLAAAAALGLSLVIAPVAINTPDSAAYAATKKDKAGKKAKKSKSGKKSKSAKAEKGEKSGGHNPLSALGCVLSFGTANYCRT